MIKYRFIFALLLLITCTSYPITANRATHIELLGWSTNGKVAFSLLQANPFNGFDSAYYIINLLDDTILLQLESTGSDQQAAKQQLISQWQSIFRQQASSFAIRTVSAQQSLANPFVQRNRTYHIILENQQLRITQGNTQKIVSTTLPASASLMASYLSPPELRIAIFIDSQQGLLVFGSNLAVGFR